MFLYRLITNSMFTSTEDLKAITHRICFNLCFSILAYITLKIKGEFHPDIKLVLMESDNERNRSVMFEQIPIENNKVMNF